MAASIGTITGFTGWRGQLSLGQRRIASLDPKPGHNGRVRVMDAWDSSDGQSIVTSQSVADATARDTLLNSARALANGNTITVTQPDGRTVSV